MNRDATDHATVKPGLLFPRTAAGQWLSKVGNSIYQYRIDMVWSDQKSAYDIRELKVKSGPEESITAVGLRQLRLQDLLTNVVRDNLLFADGRPFPIERLTLTPDEIAGLSDDQKLTRAAEIYAVARAYADPPLKAVADGFSISQSTATRMIAKARKLELLD